jgi:hypothetical protein
MPRFVLLLHECPDDRPRPTHCDLMLEAGDALETWALDELPHDWRDIEGSKIAASNSVAAEQLSDHRSAYLDYEGPVSGDRGTVKRLDAGSYEIRQRAPDRIVIDVAGQVIRGEIELRRQADDALQWQLSFRPHPPLAV